ncbi:MAG: Guanosine-5'-triphosphate,3'-diphosphate pyrophosphatase [Opitutia bacterium UBA7350]|nr:MAG: Guanosine-5'-triphosphate,3'-diphosphate pyrophosphatase [Opitutae bacterium UBA7350]
MVYDKTVAVIDVGSNSIKLLVASIRAPNNNLLVRFTETLETRISAGISHADPELTEAAMNEGLESICKLLRSAKKFEPEVIRMVATSAVRDARNGTQFIDCIKNQTNHQMQVLSGHQEAQYIGRGLACDPEFKSLDHFFQMDLGGGSLELIGFSKNQITQAVSLQLGSVRLMEAFLKDHKIPLSDILQAEISQYIHATLTKKDFDFQPLEWPLIITGGAASVTRAILAARADQSIETSSPFLKLKTLSKLRSELAKLPLHKRFNIPHLPARRADILPISLLTIETVLKYAQRETAMHSFYNLRYGLAREALNC